LTAQVLFFYIAAHRESSHAAVIQLQTFSFTLHLVNFIYGMTGKLDRYTLNIMVHEALLTNGFQFIHVLKRSDQPHWMYLLYFGLNTKLTAVEFAFAFNGYKGIIERNINICSALQKGFLATQMHRLGFTIFPFACAILLLFFGLLMRFIDAYRNKNRPRTPRYILPKWLVWEERAWDERRKIICFIGLILWIWSVITLEVFIIRDFHVYMRQFPETTSSEDAWSYGQIIPLCCSVFAFAYAVWTWFIEEMHARAGTMVMN
jgi:hypothetical protein